MGGRTRWPSPTPAEGRAGCTGGVPSLQQGGATCIIEGDSTRATSTDQWPRDALTIVAATGLADNRGVANSPLATSQSTSTNWSPSAFLPTLDPYLAANGTAFCVAASAHFVELLREAPHLHFHCPPCHGHCGGNAGRVPERIRRPTAHGGSPIRSALRLARCSGPARSPAIKIQHDACLVERPGHRAASDGRVAFAERRVPGK